MRRPTSSEAATTSTALVARITKRRVPSPIRMRNLLPLRRQRGEVDLLDLGEATRVEHLQADAELRLPVAADDHGLLAIALARGLELLPQRLERDLAALDRQASVREHVDD